MYHTLLPEAERAQMHREYRQRALILFGLMLIVSVTVGVISLFPAFIRTYLVGQAELSRASSMMSADSDSSVMVRKELTEATARLADASTYAQAQLLSNSVDTVVRLSDDVKITSLTLSSTDSKNVAISIRGTAPTRSALLSFRDRLEKGLNGGTVSLPVSELTKSTNVSFSLEVKQTLP